MKLSNVTEFKLGHIYQCIKKKEGVRLGDVEVGDFIGILAVGSTIDRHASTPEIDRVATKYVVLNDFRYTPSDDVVLSDWVYECFLEVDANTIPVELHNAYVRTMNVTPKQLGAIQ